MELEPVELDTPCGLDTPGFGHTGGILCLSFPGGRIILIEPKSESNRLLSGSCSVVRTAGLDSKRTRPLASLGCVSEFAALLRSLLIQRWTRVSRAALAALGLFVVGVTASRAEIAYLWPPGQAGNQNFAGSVGMTFVVNQPIEVTSLGVFDHLGDGIGGALTSKIWNN